MTTTIFKYPLRPEPGLYETICGEVVGFDLDPQGIPCAWVMGDADSLCLRTWAAVGTGVEIPAELAEGAAHKGMFTDRAQGLVWHLLELAPQPAEA